MKRKLLIITLLTGLFHSVMAEPFIGEIVPMAFNFCPRGYEPTNGQLLPISQNQALFSILGTMYGGDGETVFALPDLRSRVAIGDGQGPGLSNRALGIRAGSETETITSTTYPNHSHSVSVGGGRGVQGDGDGLFLGESGIYRTNGNPVNLNTTISSVGGSQAHENMPPFLTINYCIATTGLFPSRN